MKREVVVALLGLLIGFLAFVIAAAAFVSGAWLAGLIFAVVGLWFFQDLACYPWALRDEDE